MPAHPDGDNKRGVPVEASFAENSRKSGQERLAANCLREVNQKTRWNGSPVTKLREQIVLKIWKRILLRMARAAH
jgi:hypothetical protein